MDSFFRAAISSWSDRVATISSASNATAPIVIYSDRLESGWEDWSWGATRNFFDGGALSVTYGSLWGGLYLHKNVSTEGRNALSFEIAGNSGGGQNLQLYMYDTAGNQLPTQNLSRYLDGPITDGVWRSVRIPLSDLGVMGGSIQGLVLQDISGASGSSVKVKNMRIE